MATPRAETSPHARPVASSQPPRRPRLVAILAAGLAMAAVAALAVWVMEPSEPPIEPAAVAATEVLDGPELERAIAYRSDARLLYALGLVLQIAFLAPLVAGRPRAARRLLERLGRRPALGSLATGALLWIGLALATLPAGLLGRANSVDAGISTQSLGEWLYDWALSTLIGAAIAALVLAALAALWRRLGRWWWAAASVVTVLVAVAYVWLSPILIGPAFNDYRPIPASDPARAEILRLADRAGVDVGEVLSVDASRRSTSVNAYVDGLGSTKRVVVYDTLLADGERAELRSVLAHELAHVVHRDLIGGLGFIAVVAPLGLLFAGLLARRWSAGLPPGLPVSLPALVLAIGIAATLLGIFGNVLSRQVESAADAYALRLTDDPQALVSLQRRFARTNLSDPDPPALWSFLFSTHPSGVERVGAARTYAAEEARD